MNDTVTVIDQDHLLKQRREGEHRLHLPYRVQGEERDVELGIVAGEMDGYLELEDTIGELLQTPAGAETLVQKVVVDVQVGRERVPTLYQPVYRRTISDRNLPEIVPLRTGMNRARIVFLEHWEGGEVKFGTRTVGELDSLPIVTRAGGFEWTEDMEEYDKTWEFAQVSQAFGEAHNAMLNHIHLFPIIDATYDVGNITAWQVGAGPTQYERDRATIEKALQDAELDIDPETRRGRTPTIALAHTSNRWRIQAALTQRQIGGTVYPAIGAQVDTIILYRGWSEKVGDTDYVYPGVPTDRVFLIDPRDCFGEFIKHDLLVDAGEGDIKRLIKGAVVGRSRRGVYAAPNAAVQVALLS